MLISRQIGFDIALSNVVATTLKQRRDNAEAKKTKTTLKQRFTTLNNHCLALCNIFQRVSMSATVKTVCNGVQG